MTGRDRPFVGRAAELAVLQQALEDAAAGHGSVVAISGEPGIGKTSMVNAFSKLAAASGARVLHGRCYEDDWAPPYAPFVEAVEAYLADARTLPDAIGPELARLVPALAEHDEPSPTARSPQEQKYRLYQAVLGLFRHAADTQALCLVLEDLHDADSSTLELLTHLGRNLGGSRMLVVATYRNIEVQPEHPLGRSLAEIERASPVHRMALGGLSVEESADLVTAEAGTDVTDAVVRDAWSRTDGHPLFLRELARAIAGGANATERFPGSMREVIGVRLGRLGPECRYVLEGASVIGHEVQLSTLLDVVDLGTDALAAVLKEAVAAGILDEGPGNGSAGYAFHHALFREALYVGLTPVERDRLHLRVGHALEARAAGQPEYAAELAEHFSHSRTTEDLLKATGYAEAAAKRAASVYSWADAMAWYERALELLDRAGSTERERRCDLLLGLGDMLLNNGELPRLEDEVAEEAFQLAAAIDDPVRAATAAMLALRSMVQRELYPAIQTERGDTWAHRAVRYATYDGAARLRARFFAALNQGRWADLPAILDEARTINDPDLFHFVAALAMKGSPGMDAREQAIATEILLRRDEETSADLVATSSYCAGLAFASRADLDSARTAFERVLGLSRQTPVAGALAYGLCADASLRILAGDLESAVDLWQEFPESADRAIVRTALSMPLRWLGRVDELLSMQPMPGPWQGYYGVVSGDVEQARAAFDYLRLQFTSGDEAGMWDTTKVESSQHLEFWSVRETTGQAVPSRPQHSSVREDLNWSARGTLGHAVPLFVLEGAMLLGDREMVRMLVDYAQTHYRPVAAWWPFQVSDRCIGDGLAYLGDWRDARERYESALTLAQEMRFRPEIALAHLGLAETLHSGFPSESAAACEHLDACLPEFEAMHMRPALERAQALRDRMELIPVPAPTYPDGLTPREVDVLRLLAQGHRNRDIAAELVIAPATVTRHVSNILDKTGLSNRTELANYAGRNGLL